MRYLSKIVVLLFLFVMTSSISIATIQENYFASREVENGKLNCLKNVQRIDNVICSTREDHNGKFTCTGDCSALSENCTLECTGCRVRRR